MIIVFYNKDMDVCIHEYDSSDGVLSLARRDTFYNDDTNAKEFKEKIGTTSYFIDKVLLNNQSRFEGKRVIVFDDSKEGSLYDRADLIDMLFLYRREITILKANITEEDAKNVANWLFDHFPI